VHAATDGRNVAWFPVGETPDLAFDHKDILALARERLRGKVQYQPIGFERLPEKFALRQLQHLYEVILGRTLDKRNFRKKIQKLDILEPLDEIEKDVYHRATQLFHFAPKKYQRMQKRGVGFEIRKAGLRRCRDAGEAPTHRTAGVRVPMIPRIGTVLRNALVDSV
jgi:8-oxo-dGTP diphosphatase